MNPITKAAKVGTTKIKAYSFLLGFLNILFAFLIVTHTVKNIGG